MKLASIAVVALTSLVRAAPNAKHPIGATYTITNMPSGNHVLIHGIGADALVSFAGAVATGGKGVHGLVSPPDVDGLFGQGSVTVFEENLYVVNPKSDTFTWFKIDPGNPTILYKAGVFPSGGEFPTSIAVSKIHNLLCVLNGGKVNGVLCYDLSPLGEPKFKHDAFRSLGIIQTTPASGVSNSSSAVIFGDHETKLIVSVKGDFTVFPGIPGFLLSWEVSEGKISKTGVKTAPLHRAVIVSDPDSGATIYDFNFTPAKTSSITFSGQIASCWVEFSKFTGTFWFSDPTSSTIFEASVSPELEGTFLDKMALAGSPTDIAIGSIAGRDYLYVLTPRATSIGVILLAPNNQSSVVQSFNFLSGARSEQVPIIDLNLQGMGLYLKK